MISMIKDDMPHINLFTSGEVNWAEITYAYQELSTTYNGVKDFISILDHIFEGIYSLTEVMIAGIILTDGLYGYYEESGLIEQDARYIRINGIDIIYLTKSNELLTNEFFFESSFLSKDLKRFKLEGIK